MALYLVPSPYTVHRAKTWHTLCFCRAVSYTGALAWGLPQGVGFAGSEHGYMRIYTPMDGRYSSVKNHAWTTVKRPALSVRNLSLIKVWTGVLCWIRVQCCHMWSLRRIVHRKCSESLGKAPVERRTGKHETGNVCWLRAFLRLIHDPGKVESSQFRGFRRWHRCRTMPIRLASRPPRHAPWRTAPTGAPHSRPSLDGPCLTRPALARWTPARKGAPGARVNRHKRRDCLVRWTPQATRKGFSLVCPMEQAPRKGEGSTMAEEKPKPSRDGAKGITHREPRGVSKPRVGNPWRDMQGGTIGAPTMRVHGGAPSGAGVPTWQADGARGVWYSPAARESEDTSGALDASSVRRAYGVGVPEAVEFSSELRPHYHTVFDGRAVGRSFGVERQHGESTAGVSALDAPVMGPRIVHPVVSRMERFVTTVMEAAEAACVEWETLRATAMDAGDWEAAASHRTTADYFRADRVRAHLVCEETVALARELYPDTRPGPVTRPGESRPLVSNGRPFLDTIDPAARWEGPTRRDAVSWETASDPGVSIRRAVNALAPMAHGPVRTGDARRGIETGIVTTKHSKAVHPCAWCDSVACDRARNPVLPCPVYDRAASRGNPLVAQYQRAVNAHKAPKGAYREATAWAESLRETAVQRLHALDLQGADVDPTTCARGIPCAESLRTGIWRTVTAMNPMDYRGFTDDPARLAQRVDHALAYLADAEFAREAVARVGSTGVSAELRDVAAAIVSAMAPAGVWWAEPLRSYRMTAGVLGAATLALSSALRDTRDETIAQRRIAPDPWAAPRIVDGRPAGRPSRRKGPPGGGDSPRAESVTLVSPAAPPKRPPSAPRAALPSVVAIHGPETRRASRETYEAAPLVDTSPGPVTRPGESRTDPPARTPMGAPLDAPIEVLRARTRR